MSKILHVALGFGVVAAPGWRKVMPPPKKPANWKEETFQAKLPELIEAQEADAPYYPLTAQVKTLWACPLVDGATAVRVDPTPTDLITWCMKLDGIVEVLSTNLVFYGAGLRRNLRKLAVQSPGDLNAARLLVDSLESPAKVDIISYCGVKDLCETAQAFANAALGTNYDPKSAQAEAEATAALAMAYGLDMFAGKPGFTPLEW